MGPGGAQQQPADHGAALQLQIPPQPLQLVPFSGPGAGQKHLGITTPGCHQITAAEHGPTGSGLEGLGNGGSGCVLQSDRHQGKGAGASEGTTTEQLQRLVPSGWLIRIKYGQKGTGQEGRQFIGAMDPAGTPFCHQGSPASQHQTGQQPQGQVATFSGGYRAIKQGGV